MKVIIKIKIKKGLKIGISRSRILFKFRRFIVREGRDGTIRNIKFTLFKMTSGRIMELDIPYTTDHFQTERKLQPSDRITVAS